MSNTKGDPNHLPLDVPTLKAPPAEKRSASNLLIIVSTVILTSLGAATIALVEIFHSGDNTSIVTQIAGFLVPTIAVLLVLLKTQETTKAVQELHISVNSRMDALLKEASLAAHAEGVAAGTAAAKEVAIEVAKSLRAENNAKQALAVEVTAQKVEAAHAAGINEAIISALPIVAPEKIAEVVAAVFAGTGVAVLTAITPTTDEPLQINQGEHIP